MIATSRHQTHLLTKQFKHVLPLLTALFVHLATGLANLHLPGLQYDEAADAVPAVEVLQGINPSTASSITVFGTTLPLMMLPHIGPTTTYTSLLGLALLGISVEALRVSQLTVGTLALVGLWALAQRWFDGRTAALAVTLCATTPPFVWWSRAGANWTVPLLPIALFMWLALTQWWRTGSTAALLVAALLFGLGLTTKILFVWWLAPLALVGFVALKQQRSLLLTRLSALRGLKGLGAALALALGAAPLLVHNIPSSDTLRFILANAVQTQMYGHNNLDFLNNLRRVLVEFLRVMGGDSIHFWAPIGVPTKHELFVRLPWQSQAERLPDDTVLLHIVEQSTGRVVLVADKQPVYGNYPFDRWQYGEVVSDPHWLTLPTNLSAGVCQVRVGVYDRQTGVRRAIHDPQNDATGNSLMLSTFQIP